MKRISLLLLAIASSHAADVTADTLTVNTQAVINGVVPAPISTGVKIGGGVIRASGTIYGYKTESNTLSENASALSFFNGFSWFRQNTSHELCLDVDNGGVPKTAIRFKQNGDTVMSGTASANRLEQLNGKTAVRMSPGTATNAAGIFNGFWHHDCLLGSYQDGTYAHAFISTGFINGGRDISLGTASGSDYATATFLPLLTVKNDGVVQMSRYLSQTNGGVGLRVNSASVANASGLYSGFLHNDSLMGTYFEGGYARGFVSTGYVDGGRSFAIGSASSSDFTTATFVPRLTVLNNGFVGIGNANPTNLLTVNGTISAKEIKITTTGADYVFADGYRLRPLDEVERFIAEKKHLPEMMPAAQMQAEGMPVSEVVTKQLAKIEELTLYAIAARRANQELEKQTQELSRENRDLTARLQAIERLLSIPSR